MNAVYSGMASSGFRDTMKQGAWLGKSWVLRCHQTTMVVEDESWDVPSAHPRNGHAEEY
jgi:hypothetical protein